MPADFYPKREAEIVSFTENFSAQISAAPGSLGLSPAQAAEYAAVQQTFADLQQKSTQPGTNTSSVFEAKKKARRALEQLTRQLAGIVRSHPGVTATQRMELGLPVRDPGRPRGSRDVDCTVHIKRIGTPRLMVKVLNGRTLRVVLRDRSAPMSRAMPKGVEGATVFSYVGDVPPALSDLEKWKFERNTSKTVTTVRPGAPDAALPPGTKVWVMAFWYYRGGRGGRGMRRLDNRGPACEPVYAHTQYGVEIASQIRLRTAA